MHVQRQGRTGIEIPVMITTVLDAHGAVITNLTEHGAQITGCAVAEGSRFQIEYRGQIIYAQCRWSEIDRMGVRFIFPLTDGPLYERLVFARAVPYPDMVQGGAGMMLGRGAAAFGRRIS